jgi:uncharacterized membrane protein YbhN (UPF0104 family)
VEAGQRKRLWIALRIVAVVGVIALLYVFVRGIDFAALKGAIVRAAAVPLALAAILNFANMWFKANYWQVMLSSVAQVPVTKLFRYTLASLAGSALAPGRAGEALRIWLLKDRHGVGIRISAAAMALEKVADLLALLTLVAPLPWLWPEIPPWVSRSINLLLAAGVAGAVALWVMSKVPRLHEMALFQGLRLLHHPQKVARAYLCVFAAWLTDLAVVWLVILALDIDAPPAAGVLILLAVNLAIAIPAAPGGAGTLELGALAAFDLLGLPRSEGLAFGLLYHGVQVLPILTAGIIDGRRLMAEKPLKPETVQASSELH